VAGAGTAGAGAAGLAVTIERTGKIVAQTWTRPAGQTPESTARLVSLHDPEARPIRKGRTGKAVEFGHKGWLAVTTISIMYHVQWHLTNSDFISRGGRIKGRRLLRPES